MSNGVKVIPFDESSEAEEVYVSNIRQVSSISPLTPRIKRVWFSSHDYDKGCPKIVSESRRHAFVSTPGSRVIMNHFQLDVSYQKYFKQRFSIRETVRFVVHNSFSYTNHLRAVVFPSSVEEIGERAFFSARISDQSHSAKIRSWRKSEIFSFYQSALESIEIPSNVEEVGACTFNECENLRSVEYLSKSKIWFEGDAFSNCPLLSGFRINDWKSKRKIFRILRLWSNVGL